MTTFMDDASRTLLAPDAEAAATRPTISSRSLDDAICIIGVTQNTGKQALQGRFYGAGARPATRKFYKKEVALLGKPTLNMRYLGNKAHPGGRRGPDRERRLHAAEQGWAAGRGYWTSKAPLREKREMFQSLRVMAPWSGEGAEALEAADLWIYGR